MTDVKIVQTHSRVLGVVFVSTEGRWAVKMRCPDGVVRQFWTQPAFDAAVTDKPRRVGMRPSLRFAILLRDGYACRYCGRKPPDVVLHVDHVVPVSAGGLDTPDNLVTACQDCNIGKWATPLSDEMVATIVANDDESRGGQA